MTMLKSNSPTTPVFTCLTITLVCSLYPESVFAVPKFAEIAQAILNFLNNDLSRTLATIAVIFFGYLLFTGRMEVGRALTLAGGIVVVFAAGAIVRFLQG